MTRLPLVSLVLATAIFGSSTAFAEEVPSSAKPPTDPATSAATLAPPAISAPAKARVVSPALAAHLSAAVPKFEPLPTTPTAIAPGTDLREIDKPLNTIIRLPNFEVHDEKIPEMKPREMLTQPERLRLAFKKYPGLHVGSLPFFSNNGVALTMQAEDERLDRMKELNDLLSLLPTTQQKQVKPMVEDAFARKDLPR